MVSIVLKFYGKVGGLVKLLGYVHVWVNMETKHICYDAMILWMAWD